MNTEQARFNMIEQQIRTWDVLDPGVLELLAVVKREDFVPAAYRAMAFVDTEVPLPNGQSMLAPKVEARLLQELAVQRHERRNRLPCELEVMKTRTDGSRRRAAESPAVVVAIGDFVSPAIVAPWRIPRAIGVEPLL